MKCWGLLVIWFAALTLPALGVQADWFDAPPVGKPTTRPATSTSASPATRPGYPFVPGGSQATIIKSVEQALVAIQAHMDQLATVGDTLGYDQAKNTLEMYRELLKQAKETTLEPCLYPLELGKKGCLFTIRNIKSPAGTSDKPFFVDLQVVSWMKVKIIDIRADQTIEAELTDNSGKITLYKVIFLDLPKQLEPGKSVLLLNMRFECIAEEQTDTGKVYHLKKI